MKPRKFNLKLAACLALLCAGLGGVFGMCAQAGAPATASQPPAASDWHETVRDFAAGHFKHPAWGYSHSVRCYKLAHKLAAADHAAIDDDVLFAAAYLHDMAAFAPWASTSTDHADEAARVVDTVLQGTGFPMGKIEAVRGAIRTHMFERDPDGAEALYLHDADALDWLGVVGAVRVIALVDPNGGQPGAPAIVQLLDSNLEKVPSRVLSPAGRAIVPERKTELDNFLKALRLESENLKTL